jgi:predicted esterase
LNPPSQPEGPDFQKITKKIHQFYFNQQFKLGLNLALETHGKFSSYKSITFYWIACFQALLKQKEAALKTLEEGISNGIWWSRNSLMQEPDLKEIRNDLRFSQILEICDYRHTLEKQSTQPELLIRTPTNYKGQKLPILLVLHSWGSNNADFEHYWNGGVEQREILFCSLQSSQLVGQNRYGWDNEQIGHKEIHQALTTINNNFKIKNSNIIMAGASQGARTVLSAVFSGITSVRGFLLLFPAIRDTNAFLSYDEFQFSNLLKVKGIIITGEKDQFYGPNKQLSEELNFRGINCKFKSYQDLGHWFPDDFTQVLKESIDFIL